MQDGSNIDFYLYSPGQSSYSNVTFEKSETTMTVSKNFMHYPIVSGTWNIRLAFNSRVNFTDRLYRYTLLVYEGYNILICNNS